MLRKMAKAKLVQKTVQMGHRDIIKYQILTHCFIKGFQFSNSEMDCLTLLGAYKQVELSNFCKAVVQEKIFKTAQTVRNFLNKAHKLEIINKDNVVNKKEVTKKQISLNEGLNIQSEGTIILEFKIIHVATEEQ